jgi:hypothetical protein
MAAPAAAPRASPFDRLRVRLRQAPFDKLRVRLRQAPFDRLGVRLRQAQGEASTGSG